MAEEWGRTGYQPADSSSWSNDGETFSYEKLVMSQYRKVLECLSKEMREGFWVEKVDKQGNVLPIFQPDTRLEAIESIETLDNLMKRKTKGTAYERSINNLKKKVEDKYKDAVDMEKKKLQAGLITPEARCRFIQENPEALDILNGNLSDKSSGWHWYLSQKIEAYRKIFEILEECVNASRDFKKIQQGNVKRAKIEEEEEEDD